METSLLSAAKIAHGPALAVLDFPTHHDDIVFANSALRRCAEIIGAFGPDPTRKLTRSSRKLTADASGPSLRNASMSSMAESQALVEIISGSRADCGKRVGEVRERCP